MNLHESELPGPDPTARPERVRHAQAERLLQAWETPRGWRYWSAVNNSEIGVWYLAGAFAFFFFAGVLALILRAQLAFPEHELISAELYNQIFTLHGSVMMFLFAVPVLEAIAIFILPEMLGARDLPFPRLSAYGFWCFLFGGIFVCASIFFGVAPSGGWFMYPPLTTADPDDLGADIWLLGLSFIEIASIAAAVELIIGVLKCRPPGMRIQLMPLYAWFVLVVGGMILFAFPPLIAGDILLELERAFDWPFFDAERGGDPLLWQHLFWIFGHPEVYIVFLPSIAIVAMVVPTFARRAIVGYPWVVLAAIGTGFLSFGLWVHHMFTTGLPGISLGLFSAASQAVAIPTGVQLFCFIATLLVGRITRSVPLLFVFGGFATFVLGGLTGVMVALAPFDFQAHDSYFIVGHLHSVLIGGTVFPILAGVYYWYPLFRGKQLSEKLGRVSFWLLFVGFNVTFVPMHWTGLRGMRRRVFSYESELGFDILNLVSTIGAFVLAAGFAVFLFDVLRSKKKSSLSPRNPWGAGTLEWLAEMPGKPWGKRSIPEIDSRYPLWDQPQLMRDVDEGRYYLPDAAEGKRELLVTTAIDARPIQCLRVPGPSFSPLLAAAFTACAFIFATFHWWWPAGAAGVLAAATIVCWLWTGTGKQPEVLDKDVGFGVRVPLYVSGPRSVAWWAMLITMLADITAFVSLLFGYFFYWTSKDDFPIRDFDEPGLWWFATFTIVAVAWCAIVFAARMNRLDRRAACLTSLAIASIGAAGAAVLFVVTPCVAGHEATDHVYHATVWVIAIWCALHAIIGLLMLLYCTARTMTGGLTREYDGDLRNVVLYWHFFVITALLAVATVAGFPELL